MTSGTRAKRWGLFYQKPGSHLSAPALSVDPTSSHPQFQIRALESQKRQQELVLRRKTQEVSVGPHVAPFS